MTIKTYHERVEFKLYRMPCCGHLLCWVNPRKPTFCPQCGEQVFLSLTGDCIMVLDFDAQLTYHHEGGE